MQLYNPKFNSNNIINFKYTWKTNRIPSRVSTATGTQEQKYPLLIIRWTSSCTSRRVNAELGLQALSAWAASASRSFRSSSSPSLFLTNTSLIKTLSSFCRVFNCVSSADESDNGGDRLAALRERDVEHREWDFWRTERVNWVEWVVNEWIRWENELVALVKWECKVLNGEVLLGLGLEGIGRGILIDEEMKRMSSFWGIVRGICVSFWWCCGFECGSELSEVKWSVSLTARAFGSVRQNWVLLCFRFNMGRALTIAHIRTPRRVWVFEWLGIGIYSKF